MPDMKNTSDIADSSLSTAGIARVEWSESQMPVLTMIRERFAAEQPLAGLRIAACMHVTTETANLMRALRAGGAEVALCASNPLSTQDATTAALVAEYDVHTFARHGIDIDTYYRHINAALDIEPHLVFDDGCDLVNTIHSKRKNLIEGIRGGCEETTTGVHRLRQMAADGALQFPMVAVNDTRTKRMFDNRYGTGQSSLDAIMRATNVLFAGLTVVVAGYGYCGQGVAQRADGLGAKVVVTEVDPVKALDAAMQGYQVMPMMEAARIGDVFITVTSNTTIIGREHFAVMKDGAILANSGHFDVEIDVKELEAAASKKRSRIRHETDEYVMPDGRRLRLVGEGRLVNLVAAEGHPASVMDLSFAAQALTGEWLARGQAPVEPGVYEVPAELDEQVARLKLNAMGIAIDTVTAVQQDYVNSWQHGS
jgi:adenosylhomocysteinase